MRLRFGRVITSTVALAAAAVMLTPGSASAADTPSGGWDHIYSASGVNVYVEEHGDIITVCDAAANGASAWLEVYESASLTPAYSMRVTSGFGSCLSHQASHGAKYDLDEGRNVFLTFEGHGDAYEYSERYFLNDH